jgi:hypothetical protein
MSQNTFINIPGSNNITGNVAISGNLTVSGTSTLNAPVLIGGAINNGIDALQINGGLTANYIKLYGLTSGYVELTVPSVVSTYILSLPAAQGSASSYLINDGSGNLSWTSGTPPVVTNNIDGGSSATLYTSPQIITGGTP